MKHYPHSSIGQKQISLVRLINCWVAVLTVVLLTVVAAPAQTTANQSTDESELNEGIEKGWNEFGIWGGVSFHAPTLIGKTPEARVGNLGLRYGRVLAASKNVAFEYTVDIIPVAALSLKRFTAVQVSPGVFSIQQSRESVYGAGAAPIGLKLNFRRQKRVQPFAAITGGFLYFSEQVPVAGASQFNFTYDVSGGIQIVNSNKRAFSIGYKYHHISNGYTATFNPGVDIQMIYGGFSIFK
ncbi:MAG TPA: acyloxyacyl hydrolase [Pyrinomonadaceae bacterium]